MRSLDCLSGLDVAFLAFETPTMPMNIMGILLLDAAGANGGYSFERVVRVMQERAPRLAPLRRRLVPVPLGLDHPVWIDDPKLRVRSHLHRVRAPAPGTERVLAQLVARIASQPLDRSRPLWELWVVERLAEGRVALVFKLHHAAADGVSAAALLLQLLDPSPDAPAGGRAEVPSLPPSAPTRLALLAHAASRLPQRSARLPRLLRETIGSAVGVGRSMTEAEGRPPMAMPFRAPRTPWNQAISSRRNVAFGSARLDDVKRVCAAFGATVNHVVLAACTQTLRSYLEAHGGVPAAPLVATVPVSLRGSQSPGTGSNQISAFFVHLPVQVSDPVEQLRVLRRDADASRQAETTLAVGALGRWAEFASTGFLRGAARIYSGGKLANRHRPIHNLVISNVRGPADPLYAAGARLVAAYPLGPPMDGAGVNITVLSYAGSVGFGIIACARAVPQAGDIALGFGAAVARLLKIAIRTTSERTAG